MLREEYAGGCGIDQPVSFDVRIWCISGGIAKGTGYAGLPVVKTFEDGLPIFLDGAA